MLQLPDGYFVGRIVALFPERGYGFVRLTTTGERVFFHIIDGHTIDVAPGRHYPFFGAHVRLFGRLDLDVQLVFKVKLAREGPRACPWGLYAEWDGAMEQITENRRSLPPRYR